MSPSYVAPVSRYLVGVTLLSASALVSCTTEEQPHALEVEIVDTHPFDPASFTQGVEVDENGDLLVGTGMYGQSRIYRTTVENEQTDSHDLSPDFFGEGITNTGEKIWQLTWQENTAIARDPGTLEELSRAQFDGEGWGICYRENHDELIMSDGTDSLRRLDPETFEERERFTVTNGYQEVTGLNELECVGDSVYANIFTTTDIVQINAESGKVEANIDASAIPNKGPAGDPNSVLNGIAAIPGTNRFYLTGKLWPEMYEVRFTPTE